MAAIKSVGNDRRYKCTYDWAMIDREVVRTPFVEG